ncbi:hypothetical protein CBM2633_A50670 [Cupriavidus taiwanensis]|nr:hypothetical protein CBM2633_A50670 [Cupriavidus taiwanensis]
MGAPRRTLPLCGARQQIVWRGIRQAPERRCPVLTGYSGGSATAGDGVAPAASGRRWPACIGGRGMETADSPCGEGEKGQRRQDWKERVAQRMTPNDLMAARGNGLGFIRSLQDSSAGGSSFAIRCGRAAPNGSKCWWG